MRITKEFINRTQAEFLQICNCDYQELKANGPNNAENIAIERDALECLQFFPNIKHLILKPGFVYTDNLNYLYGLPIISLKLDYYTYSKDECQLDLSQFHALQLVFSRTQYNFCNVSECQTLKTLIVQEWLDDDLRYISNSNVCAIDVFGGKLKSLNGLKSLPHLMSLSLSNQRNLQDVSELTSCSNLESLSIEACNRINIAAIPGLPNLRYMNLYGKYAVPNLSFLNSFPRLEHISLEVNIEDGILDALLKYEHCVIFTDRRHFNYKNRDLPKASNQFHSLHLPGWLEILPEAR